MKNNKPTILISKCIEHGYCRYDSGQIASEFVRKLEDYVNFIIVCPEVEINLPIPREGMRIIIKDGNQRLVYFNSGTDVTKKMIKFSKDFVEELKETTIHGCILKSNSPTCGVEKVKVFKGVGKQSCLNDKTLGFFGREVVKKYQRTISYFNI